MHTYNVTYFLCNEDGYYFLTLLKQFWFRGTLAKDFIDFFKYFSSFSFKFFFHRLVFINSEFSHNFSEVVRCSPGYHSNNPILNHIQKR